MYKAFTSLWSKSTSTQKKNRLSSVNSSDSSIDEDSWVIVGNAASKISPPVVNNNVAQPDSIMTNSWVASPPIIRTDQSPSVHRLSSPSTHHFNPIENLLIEHASMSVYEQIASRTRSRRHRKTINNQKLDEQVEEIQDNDQDDEDDDDPSSVALQYTSQHANITSTHHQNSDASLNRSTNSSTSALESSTSSLVAHQRHLQRMHQRRRRTTKSSAKLILSNNMDESKSSANKLIDRQRFNYARTPKLLLHQPYRANH